MAEAVVVGNLAEINRAINKLGPVAAKASRVGLLQVAEPVRQDAGRLSQLKISGMKRAKKKPPPWSVQRTGQTVHEVYVVPRERGVKSRTDSRRRRPYFAVLMLEKAYDPALERNEVLVRNFVGDWLSRGISTI